MKNLEDKIKKDYRNIAGIVILKDGELVYENYFHECTSQSYLHVYSVTKSILSILIGIAIDQGYIKSIHQKVLDFFPNYEGNKKEKTIYEITLKDLLTMTAPYRYKFFPPYIKYFTSDDYVTFTLNQLGGKGKIGDFRYTPLIGPDILSGIITQATGKSVFDFATEYLFQPLDITVKETIFFHSKEEQLAFNQSTNTSGWVTDSMGNNTGGWGLSLSARDMAKIGQLYLNQGKWKNQQIVSKEWITDSTMIHSRWKKENLAYGYLWWIVDPKEHACAAMGDGGNVIYFNPHKKLVVAINSLFKQKVKDRIDFIKQEIEPNF